MNRRFKLASRECQKTCPLRSHACYAVDLELSKALTLLAEHGPSILMMKEFGLTTLTKIQLGSFKQTQNYFKDRRSRLKLSRDVTLIAFQCPLQQCFRVALTSHPKPGISYLTFDQIPWVSHEAEALRTSLHCRPRTPDQPCLRGCQMWLDDWSDHKTASCFDYEREETLNLFNKCDVVKVDIQQGGVSRSSPILPHFLDLDGDILRIREAGQKALAIIKMPQAHFVKCSDYIRVSARRTAHLL